MSDGLGFYRYRYMWDEPDCPERYGFMAQEVREYIPHAVIEDPATGYLRINPDAIFDTLHDAAGTNDELTAVLWMHRQFVESNAAADTFNASMRQEQRQAGRESATDAFYRSPHRQPKRRQQAPLRHLWHLKVMCHHIAMRLLRSRARAAARSQPTRGCADAHRTS